jgi:glycosyltransferase involved in cell wall biosynthesis
MVGGRMRRTVLHILGTADVGGTGIARIVIASAMALRGLDFDVRATFMDGDGPLIGRLIEAGIPADAVYWGGARNVAGGLRVWRHLRQTAPDIVHQHFGGGYLRTIVRAAGVPRVIAHFHSHGTEYDVSKDARHSALLADETIATSRSVASTVTDRSPQVIYPAVVATMPEPFAHLDGRAPVIGALSRLAYVKGYPYLLRAMPAVLSRIPDARLEIAGDGEEYERLKAEIDRLGIAHAVSLLGWQTDLDPLFARWRVFAAPSLMEGLGISILEAAMRGLPIVASRVGGVPELIEDGVTGLLVPPAEPQALADALVAMLSDASSAHRMAHAAATRARVNFAPETFERAMREVYGRL